MFMLGVNVYQNRKQLDCTLFGLRDKRGAFIERASKQKEWKKHAKYDV